MAINLSDCKMGAVVQRNQIVLHLLPDRKPLGHVVGFDLNPQNETLVVVQWEFGETYPVHPFNLSLYVGAPKLD